MKIYLARHGQVLPKKFIGTTDRPVGEIELSDLGEKQAECLGKALQCLNFQGKILSSPYIRTMQTADIAAAVCGALVYPEPAMREGVFSHEKLMKYKGSTLETLREKFAHISPDTALPHPWWTTEEEEPEDVLMRMTPFLDQLFESDHQEVLLVGHGASVNAAIRYFARRLGFERPRGLKNLNCSLSCFELDDCLNPLRIFLFDTAHLPDEYLTSNADEKERVTPFKKEW